MYPNVATQGGVAGGVGQPAGKGILPGDQIMVTLTASKGQGGERISIAETFDHQGFLIDNSGTRIGGQLDLAQGPAGKEPVFDANAYTAALKGEDEVRAAELVKSFRTQLAAYRGQGGATTAERIGNAVLAYLKANHGVKETDGNNLVLRREQMVVKAPFRAAPDAAGVWLLQLAPTWGC